MRDHGKPIIAFLTTRWENVDENIRQGKLPAGVPSISLIWTTCLSHGFDVHVFILCQPDRGWPKETIELGGVKFHWIREPFPRLSKWLLHKELIGLVKPLWMFSQLKMLWRICKVRIKPDIIYCMRPTFIWLGYLWSRLIGAKCILRLYGTPLYSLWFEEKRWLPRIANLGALLAFRVPVDLLIVTNDGSQGNKVADWLGFPKSRFKFWLNGVDKSLKMQDFNAPSFKQSIGIPPDAPMLMTLGRLTAVNRIDRAINAMPAIIREVPNARLIVVGGGELRDELEQQAKTLGLTEVVNFTGPVPHDQIKYYLNACDVFIQVNDRTNLRNVLIEAMTAGCCIITRDVGATTEIAKDGQNAVVLSPGEPEDIAAAAVRLLKDPIERKRLADGAYRYAMEHFQTWEERMEMEVEELKRLLAKKAEPDK